jgi:hypothetical protein
MAYHDNVLNESHDAITKPCPPPFPQPHCHRHLRLCNDIIEPLQFRAHSTNQPEARLEAKKKKVTDIFLIRVITFSPTLIAHYHEKQNEFCKGVFVPHGRERRYVYHSLSGHVIEWRIPRYADG